MKICLFLNFPGRKRFYAWTTLPARPPLHTFMVFPTKHSEVKGFLSAYVTETTMYLGLIPAHDYIVVDLQPYFTIDIETFLRDQEQVGRFTWIRDDQIDPASN